MVRGKLSACAVPVPVPGPNNGDGDDDDGDDDDDGGDDDDDAFLGSSILISVMIFKIITNDNILSNDDDIVLFFVSIRGTKELLKGLLGVYWGRSLRF